MTQGVDFIFSIITLIMSVIIHEVSHGYMAFVLGDSTAKDADRLNLNPMNHLDLWGSFIVPLLTYKMGGFIFGWAKPVPYNPYNLKNQKWGPALVAIAGPLSNFFIAFLFGTIIRLAGLGVITFLPMSFLKIVSMICAVNIALGVFNLVPIPPLDGSKILFAVLPFVSPRDWYKIENFLERYGFIILIIFIFYFFDYLFPIINFLFRLFTGMGV